MSKRWFMTQAVGLLLMLATVTSALSYEGETHGFITYQAYNLSGLSKMGTGTIVNRLGLDRLDVSTPFTAYWLAPLPDHGTYYDNAAVVPNQYPSLLNYAREPNQFEQCQMQNLLTAGWISASDPIVVSGTVANLPVQNWLLRGVLREDDLTSLGYSIDSGYCGQPDDDPAGNITRVMNHFYDPINNVALTTGCASFGYNGVCAKSVDWALGFVDSFASTPVIDTNRRNHFTYEDARENMWLALTGERGSLSPPYTALAREEDSQERIYRWATVFRSLGDVIHLLQDGAQPQHVRNDKHSPYTSSQEQQAFELYTNGRVLKQTASSQNAYVRGFYSGNQDPQLPAMVPGTYNEVTFATPLRFFTTRLATDTSTTLPDGRFGMMDYANRGFFTGGTLPGDTDFLEPPQTINSANGYATSSAPCALSVPLPIFPSVNCAHITHTVEDNVESSYVDQLPSGFTVPPVAQVGVMSSIGTLFGITPPHVGFAIGLEEMQTQANLAIPRAIAYSAGLIDYFFRGQLSVTPPADGIYAMVNHGTQHTVNAQGYPCQGTSTADGCPVFGFEQVRLNVQNTTPAMTESGTGNPISTATGGTGAQLVAVARYHRNVCYAPNLSGEVSQDENGVIYPPAGCTIASMRSAYQEISVSAPMTVSSGMLDGTQPVALTFDFSADPIPINATDLFLQVVYRGPLGSESDGIAVGTVDISEPTYIIVFNGTDYVMKNGQWVTPSGTDPAPVALTTIQICGATSQIFGSSTPGLPVTHVLRLAALRDFTSQNYSIAVAATGVAPFSNSYDVWQGKQRQAIDEQGAGFNPDPIFYGRGEVLADYGTYAYQFVPPLPNPLPSQYGLPTPSTAMSENLGAVIVPGTTACPF